MASKVGEKSISAYGEARSTVEGKPLDAETIRKMNAWFRASMYLCLGMLYLRDNPLLKEPLKLEHLKARLLGHWGSDAGQSFTWMHMNRQEVQPRCSFRFRPRSRRPRNHLTILP
jgi:xylulose-5-phosphate/fructose-6-phosphate phosphoketolase